MEDDVWRLRSFAAAPSGNERSKTNTTNGSVPACRFNGARTGNLAPNKHPPSSKLEIGDARKALVLKTSGRRRSATVSSHIGQIARSRKSMPFLEIE